MKPFFSYYGSKWRIATRYGRPQHDTVIEPFAGSASYSVRWGVPRAILYDTNPVVIGVWEYLISVTEREMLALPDLQPEQTLNDLAIPQEARWLIGFSINAAVSSPCLRPSKWMRQGENSAQFWSAKCRARIAAQLSGIRAWKAVVASYADIDVTPCSTWFVDPPYADKGKHYPFGASQMEYKHLATWCRALQGQVIVCENDGATWLPFRPLHHAQSQRKGRISREVVWP